MLQKDLAAHQNVGPEYVRMESRDLNKHEEIMNQEEIPLPI